MNCSICNHTVRKILDLKNLPVCHRFLYRPGKEQTFPFSLGVCESCATVQLTEPFPVSQILPVYDWVTYNEPEAHLDETASQISQMISFEQKICGISYKDDSLLARLERKGFGKLFRIDPESLGGQSGGVETVQHLLTQEKADRIIKEKGRFDLIIARHILEHAYHIKDFVSVLKSMLNENGILFLEVPDYTKQFETFDYASLWEEHLVYFTPATIQSFVSAMGLAISKFEIFSYPSENVIAVFTQKGRGDGPSAPKNISQEIRRAERFALNFESIQQKTRQYLSREKRVAVFGAGHTACFLVNAFGLKDQIDFFIDDDINKQGLLMPGSQIPIAGSEKLSDIDLCILCVNPGIEKKIIEKNKQVSTRFLSFSPVSERSIFKEMM